MESVAVGMALVGVDGRTDLRVLHDRAHDIVGAAHPKAMPVILRTADEVEAWLTLPQAEALIMQKPLPDGCLKTVSVGVKQD